jgi:hypothetical protein
LFKKFVPLQPIIHVTKLTEVADKTVVKSLDKRLLDLDCFDDIIRELVIKHKSRAESLSQGSGGSDVSLQWVLTRQSLVRKTLRETLHQDSPVFSPVKKSSLFSGKWRDIYIANWIDRILLMMLARHLESVLCRHWHPSLYSFRKGWSSKKALSELAAFLRSCEGRLFVLKRDVTQYGDSIPTPLLLGRLFQEPELQGETLFQKLLTEALRPQVTSETPYSLCRGVPSGSPLVPVLENYYLLPLDQGLREKAEFFGRYGDDFIVAFRDPKEARAADQWIETHLARWGLRVKDEKKLNITLTVPSDGFIWLGRWIQRDGRLGPKTKRLTQALLILKTELNSLVWRSRQIRDSSARDRMLRRGLRQIFHVQRQHLWQRTWSESESPRLQEDLQKHALQFFHRALRKNYRLSSRETWAWVRRIHFAQMNFGKAQKTQVVHEAA